MDTSQLETNTQTIERLTRERDQFKIQLEAWQSAFGTTQLTHATSRMFSSSVRIGMPTLHPLTAGLVLDFSKAMADKLALAERKYGYTDGWANPDGKDWPEPLCYERLMEHLRKGDPRDVANYCAFLWFHNLSTAKCLKP